MQKPKDKYDDAMQAYAQSWMKTLGKPRNSTNISNFFVAIFVFMWSSTLTGQLGYKPSEGFGIIVIFTIAAVLILALLLINFILTRVGFSKPIRSALWFGALIGPYISIAAMNNLVNPALSHIVGVFSALLAFLLSYALDKFFDRKYKSTDDAQQRVIPNIET